MSTTDDVVDLLVDQHERIRGLLARVAEAAPGPARQEAFAELRRLLAVHETAEEMVVHPAMRRFGANDVVDARLAEEHDAKEALSTLDGMDMADPAFDDRFATLRTMVLEHAEAEERDELPLLREHASSTERVLMRRAVQAAEAVAPTHPHAGVESLTANVVVGPAASVVDRARDAVRAVLGSGQ
ncbi:MAG: hemerythrin domain-containing protein [Nocardioides sp.]|nr:hemerythrin domain-containing protein [Nocardioides sp.]